MMPQVTKPHLFCLPAAKCGANPERPRTCLGLNMRNGKMTNLGKGVVKAAIESKISAALSPTRLIVIDESAHHAGHRGHHSDGESHFRVNVTSAAFRGKSRIERHRIIHEILAEELAGRVHALALVASAPEEAE
uniref:BolA-like protein n=1 Tax=uncultured Methylocystis sp. GSC357 TaxID=373382 RepID=Q0ZKX4_9HYPH|nr:BolA-like protein [uncultured Methylocystis sp. GSC357]